MTDLDKLLEDIGVLPPGMWENDNGPEGWFAVCNDDGIIAYFGKESDAYRFRLDYINQLMNPIKADSKDVIHIQTNDGDNQEDVVSSARRELDLDRFFDKIDSIVNQAIMKDGQKEILVSYSANKNNENNLNEIAVKGKVKLFSRRDEFFGGPSSEDYISPILENPTWLQVAVHANAMIAKTKDEHHCFLEGLNRIGEEDEGFTLYEFSMGS